MNRILREILKKRNVNATILVLASLATVFVGIGTSDLVAQSQNQTQQGNQSGVGSIEELEKLTAPLNTTDKSTGLMEGLEKSQMGESVPGEQDVQFEGQQANQTEQSANQTEQSANQSSGPLQELGEQITGLFK